MMVIEACTGVSSVIAMPRNARKSETVGATPGDAALAIQTLKVTNQHHPKVNSRRNAGPAAFFVIGGAKLFDELIKTRFGQTSLSLG